MSDFTSVDLRQRIRHAWDEDYVHSSTANDDQSRMDRYVKATITIVLLAFLGLVLYVIWQEGDRATAQRCLVTVNAIALQVAFLMRVYPAFAPPLATLRRLQRFLPIRQSEITRKWYRFSYGATMTCGVLIGIVALAALITRVDPVVVLTNVLWQALVLAGATQLGFVIVSRCGRMSWISSIVFWFYVLFAVIGVHGIPLADQYEFAAIFAGPAFVMLMIPNAINVWLGDLTTLAIVIGCVMTVISLRRGVPNCYRPSMRRLRKISESWRNLPDRDDPTPGNLNYPRVKKQAERPDEMGPQSVSRELRQHIACPKPRVLVDDQDWRRFRFYAIAFLLCHMTIGVALAVLNVMNNAPPNFIFALGAVVIHLPAALGIVKAMPMMHSRLVGTKSLVRIALRGLVRDTVIAAVILTPAVVVIGQFTGDYFEPLRHVGNSLAVAAVLRVAWIPLLRFQQEVQNLAIAWWFVMGSFFPGAIIVSSVCGLLGWDASDSLMLLPPVLGGIVAIIGWDRIAAKVHPHVPRLQATWSWMNKPIRITLCENPNSAG